MSEIPFRSLATAPTSLRLSENFDIRSVEQVLGGSDVVQALHRHGHDFWCTPSAAFSSQVRIARATLIAHPGERALPSPHAQPPLAAPPLPPPLRVLQRAHAWAADR
ncbi:MAG TPA: hypothetical protein PKE21_08805 [Flavobacteriales bacterium]|nr:hypothetical protein [Flavobacteriales bacterium]HMR27561.1 hypothetical protein [Flavobacteriales bacterium]